MMTIEESNIDFPRSYDNNEDHQCFQPKDSFRVPDDELLFKTRRKRTTEQPKFSSKSKKSKKHSEKNIDINENSVPNKSVENKIVIENLSFKCLVENTVIYGCLQEIRDFELKFSISGGMIITVPITNISTIYTALIKDFVRADSNEKNYNNSIPKLQSFFSIGDHFPVKVLSKKIIDKFGHNEIIGSINPKDVYSNFTDSNWANLPQGFNLIASVHSKEDYGYLLDIGSDDFKCFLSNEDLKNHLKLEIGKLINCSVKEVTERTIKVIDRSSKFILDGEVESAVSLQYFSPGALIRGMITNITTRGLEIALCGSFRGFVPRNQLSDDHTAKPSQFKIGQTVQGHVRYVQQHTRQVCCSLKNQMSRKQIKNLIDTIHVGLILDKATVCSRLPYGNILLRIISNFYAIALKKNLFEPKEYNEDDHQRLFQIGSIHRVRVKKIHLIDNLIEVSLRKSFIERKEIRIEDIEVGSILLGTIRKYKSDGIYLKLGFGLNGFVPNHHLTDVPLINISKKLESLFPLKKEIKCRVFRLDRKDSRMPKITLTLKRTLIKMNGDEMFVDFDLIRSGSQSIGTVCLVTRKGILLEFFNRIRGFVPKKFLAVYKIEHPEKVFRVGQLVGCTVISVIQSKQRLVCSLVDPQHSSLFDIKSNPAINSSQNEKLRVGQRLKRMKIIAMQHKGFYLIDSREKYKVFLPMSHLSDDIDLNRILFHCYKINDLVDEVMVFSKDSLNVVTVTRKSVFLQNATHLVTDANEIEINKPFPVVVKRVTSTGVFFETPNAYCGVVRRKFLHDGFYDEPQKLGLVGGQTIFVAAYEIATSFEDEKQENQKDSHPSYLKNYKFTMKLSQILDHQIDNEIIRNEILRSYLNGFNFVRTKWQHQSLSNHDHGKDSKQDESDDMMRKRLSSFTIGQVVFFTVESIIDDEIKMICSLDGVKDNSTVPGIVDKMLEFDTSILSISQMGMAIVTGIDFERNHLILFFEPKTQSKLIRQVKNFKQSNLEKLRLNQIVKATVIGQNSKFVLVILGGHLPGLLAYVPIRRHWNDLRQSIEKFYTIGANYQFQIKYFNDDRSIVFVSPNVSKVNKVTKSEKIEKRTLKSALSSKAKIKFTPESKSTLNFDWNVDDLRVITNGNKTSDDGEDGNDTFNWIDSDNDYLNEESDDDVTLLSAEKNRKSRLERNEEAHQRESRMREIESRLADIGRMPENEKDFEMAVIASPNSSLVWIRFMAFYLERKQFDQARKIGERALQQISFREEKEKLNIWISLLNLENNYGDDDTMQELIEKAIKFNDAKVIYSNLARIYEESSKQIKADSIYKIMMKRFHSDADIWIEYMMFLMRNNQQDQSRKLFEKAKTALPKHCHVELISKFGQIEFRYGDVEKAKTIFEILLATNWKRLDKWFIYIDALIKFTLKPSNQNRDTQNDVRNEEISIDSLDYVRNIFERLLTFKFSPHQMRSVFKKYYDFESKYSGENFEIIEKLKRKASEMNETLD